MAGGFLAIHPACPPALKIQLSLYPDCRHLLSVCHHGVTDSVEYVSIVGASVAG